ncbi:hypothetical protein ANN_00710 [Periplaneta americana]|uniref:Tc1-like transposase DDE domain-containing protein n=1 Tax=Periplaneta americana TaxID=6978 RepID=A0ABQ8TUD8_PERAM|nr:hypothetical protein ANN_00710 [Periplaneta americana]
MQAWLRYHNIPYDPCYTKPVLYDIVKRSKDRFRTYEIDTAAVQHGHTVLRLPPYHCDFNPIELIWTQVKSDVAKHNTDFKIRKTKELFEAALEKITPENWSSVCEHVRYIEDFYRSKDGIVDELLDSFAINLEESDTAGFYIITMYRSTYDIYSAEIQRHHMMMDEWNRKKFSPAPGEGKRSLHRIELLGRIARNGYFKWSAITVTALPHRLIVFPISCSKHYVVRY